MQDTNRRFRRGYLIALTCLILFWGVASWLICSELGIKIKAVPLLNLSLVPFAILSWPAHQICLEISGLGAGYNARIPVAFWTFLIFLVYAVVLWLPMIVSCLRKFKIWPFMIVQCVILLALFLSFWQYGNG